MKSLSLLSFACTALGTLVEEAGAPAGSRASPEGDGACLLQKPTGKGADEDDGIAEPEAFYDGAEDGMADLQAISMVDGSGVASQTCYGYTGGTCHVGECAGERNAKCHKGKCVCEAACASASGQCWTGQSNTLMATGFTLTNVKWPKYRMYFQQVSAFGQLKTTKGFSALSLGKDRFSLYKLPGNTSPYNSRFFLGSVKWKSRVARIAHTTGTAVSGHAFYSTNLADGKSPDELALFVCYNKAKGALLFGRTDGKYWAYLKHGSWLVYAYEGALWNGTVKGLGDGGLWKPNPPLDPVQMSQIGPC